MADQTDPSIRDLCRPLSAKDQPKGARFSISGREIESEARIRAANGRKHQMRKKPKGGHRHG